MEITEKLINTFKSTEFAKWKLKAEVYLGDREKAQGLVRKAIVVSTMGNKGYLSKVWDKLILALELARDWANGSYRVIPKASIALIIMGILYLVSPLDMIPDIFTPIGFLDDAAVLGFVFKQVGRDLQAYKTWKGVKEYIIEPSKQCDIPKEKGEEKYGEAEKGILL